MTKSEFLAEFAEMLGVDSDVLAPETELSSLSSWDSVAYLSAMVLIDSRLGVTVRPEVFGNARTMNDILTAVNHKLKD